ncbi:MAG: hypothetical protein ABIA92_00125 [Patescibacteria group bacterium]
MESESLLGATPELYYPTIGAESFWHGLGTAAVIAGAALITYWGIKAIVSGKNPFQKSGMQYNIAA